jgi:aspartyl-tRNA(Asn)/glutamyl-tRNA(Gln) amidotransferase subunit B
MKYEPVIGLEIHAQLATRTKAYCSCEVDTKALENTRVCEVCCAHPGTLPTLNRSSGEFAVKLALATHCQVNPISFFDRKNYFYPDLPKGYQITQYEVPIAVNGWLEIETEDGSSKRIGIERIQLEEDAGKSVHEGDSSLVNLNRSGTPLVEIVGRPDLRHSKEASAYLRKVLSILTYLDICKGNLQEGNFRCDVNVSLRPQGAEALGIRTEMKNLNSFRSVEKAIEAEIGRQTGLLNAGGVIVQETLNFDPMNGKITILREKSEAHDYRYFPEPDLLPLIVSEGDVERIRQTLPELPDAKIKRFVEKYEIPLYDASVLASQKTLAAYFEEAVSAYLGSATTVSNWIMTE